MPDISMCNGHNLCGRSWSCFRYKARPSPYRQSYFAEAPLDMENLECEWYWPILTRTGSDKDND